MPKPTNNINTFAAQLFAAAADVAAGHEDDARHFIHTSNGWRPISRLAHDCMLEDGVDVRLMRVER